MTIELDENMCCGCGVCVSICTKNAITMVEDEMGFLYPRIDDKKCNDCGLCEIHCAFQKEHSYENTIKKIYAVQHYSENVMAQSSSGGAFTALSDVILDEDGVIYGAELDNSDFTVRHKCAFSHDERDRFRESKYVQSQTIGIFEDVDKRLKEGRKVLFSGTPCQCAALKRFLHNDMDNLIVVDLLCHGVPSNKILKDHIKLWEEKTGKKAINYHYRTKRYGYEYTHQIDFGDGSENHSIELKRLLKLYTISMRPSCYNCQYASRHRYGDITIGDLWDAGKVAGFYDNKGTSLLIVNTKNGEELLKKANEKCLIKEVKIDLDKISTLNHCVKKGNSVDEFWMVYITKGYKVALEKFAPNTIKSAVYQRLLRVLAVTKTDRIYIKLKSKF